MPSDIPGSIPEINNFNGIGSVYYFKYYNHS